MTILIWLRIACDLAFYYSYAAFVVSLSGSALSLPGILVPSLLCALSRRAGDRRALRIAAVLPAALLLLLPAFGVWDRIALVPAIAYAVYLAREGNYSLSHERQTDIFLLFGKSYPVFFAVIALMGGFRLLAAYSLPPALITVVLCVYLLRVLRHEPEIYSRPGFLLRNMWTLGTFAMAAWLMHLETVTNAVRTVLLTIFNRIIAPLLWAILYIIAWIFYILFTPIMQLFSGTEMTSLDIETGLEDSAEQTVFESSTVSYPLLLQALKLLAVLVLAAAVCAVLILLFRRLAGNPDRTGSSDEIMRITHRNVHAAAPDEEERLPASPLHPVNQIRRQYRRYLKLCYARGYTPHLFYTSRDIRRETAPLFSGDDAEAVGELRELYIRARYHGDATREDAIRAARLVQHLQASRDQ